MLIFLMILILGFFFEWNRDLLNWSSNKKIKC
jgi:NADH:ubiquinone oxidoreductase subunit 3 (subunit A)